MPQRLQPRGIPLGKDKLNPVILSISIHFIGKNAFKLPLNRKQPRPVDPAAKRIMNDDMRLIHQVIVMLNDDTLVGRQGYCIMLQQLQGQ